MERHSFPHGLPIRLHTDWCPPEREYKRSPLRCLLLTLGDFAGTQTTSAQNSSTI